MAAQLSDRQGRSPGSPKQPDLPSSSRRRARRSRKALPVDITVYSKPLCVQCDATKRALSKAGVDYSVVDITEDADALAKVKSLGYVQAPVVITSEDHWSGFRPDKIKAIAAASGEQRRSAAI